MIINISSTCPPAAISPASRPQPTAPPHPARNSDGDTLELSRRAEAVARAAERSSLQIARSRAIRAEIEAGTYETAERINGTVARILDVIA